MAQAEVASRKDNAPASVARILRREIIAAPEGAHLGSEAELLARLGVSSPTLRQAARLLEQQQLLTVGRGNRGGYYGRRPNAGATAQAAALYLEASGTLVAEVRSASRPLMMQASRLAAGSEDAAARAAFATAYQAYVDLEVDGDIEELVRRDRDMVGAMLRLAGNPAIELFLQVAYRLGGLRDLRVELFRARPEFAEAWRRHSLRFGAAILEGDPGLAALFAERGMDVTSQWVGELEAAGLWAGDADKELRVRVSERPSATQGAAEALREMVLAHPSGAYLGAEEELARRFKVSRHTMRQAAAIAQHDGILEVRRGASGGFVGVRPSIDRVVDAVALYLELNHGNLRHLQAAATSLAADSCRVAALSTAADYAARLTAARERMAAVGLSDDFDPPRSILRAEQQVMDTILHLGGNRATELFVRSMYRHGGALRQPVRDGADRIERWRRARLRLIDALLERDGEAAAVICGRIGALLDEWMD